MERQKKYKNCVKNSQKELRFENKFVITYQQDDSDGGFLYCIQGNPHET